MIFFIKMFGGRSVRHASVAAMCVLVVALGGCSKTDSPHRGADAEPTETKSREPAVSTPIDACSLLTREEIEAVQGEPPQDAKSSAQSAGGLMRYDCLFTLPTFTDSISLSVTQSAPGAGARDPRETWREMLAAAESKASEKSPPPRKIDGIGDEAFWSGDDRMGALYVLKGSRQLRISVGGPGDRETKIEKSRTLAEVALKKL